MGCLNRQKVSSLRDTEHAPLSRTPDWGHSLRPSCGLRNRRELGTPLSESISEKGAREGRATDRPNLSVTKEQVPRVSPPLQNVLEEVQQEEEETVATSESRADLPKSLLSRVPIGFEDDIYLPNNRAFQIRIHKLQQKHHQPQQQL